jgi:phosphoribosylaminoimidazole-succinocarboxamide synthase
MGFCWLVIVDQRQSILYSTSNERSKEIFAESGETAAFTINCLDKVRQKGIPMCVLSNLFLNSLNNVDTEDYALSSHRPLIVSCLYEAITPTGCRLLDRFCPLCSTLRTLFC